MSKLFLPILTYPSYQRKVYELIRYINKKFKTKKI